MSITDDLHSNGVHIRLGQDGSRVILTFTCTDDREAMLLYDKILAAAVDGGVSLSFTSNITMQ